MRKEKKYWKGLAELKNDSLIEKLKHNEFVEEIPVEKLFENNDLVSCDVSLSTPTLQNILRLIVVICNVAPGA